MPQFYAAAARPDPRPLPRELPLPDRAAPIVLTAIAVARSYAVTSRAELPALARRVAIDMQTEATPMMHDGPFGQRKSRLNLAANVLFNESLQEMLGRKMKDKLELAMIVIAGAFVLGIVSYGFVSISRYNHAPPPRYSKGPQDVVSE